MRSFLQLYHSYVDGNATDNTPAGTDGCPTPVDNDVAADPQTCVSTKTQVRLGFTLGALVARKCLHVRALLAVHCVQCAIPEVCSVGC